jgi:hypothetical protein
MMWTDGKALLWLSAFFFIILPIFLGGLAGGVVGGLRGRPIAGLCWGIFGGFASGFIGVVITSPLWSSGLHLYVGGVLFDRRGQIIYVACILIGAVLCAKVFVRQPAAPTGNANSTRPTAI